jgi:hypothetical protein
MAPATPPPPGGIGFRANAPRSIVFHKQAWRSSLFTVDHGSSRKQRKRTRPVVRRIGD